VNRRPISASFIGIDLAWSDRNPSGLAHLHFNGKEAVLLATDSVTSDEEILRWIEERSGRTTWIGIDAPIIAPNPPKTSRAADKIVTSLFGRFHAGVYPGNRKRCARPIRLCKKLAAIGFSPDPFLPSRSGRRQLEIFPHLAQIALFGRKRIIKYKKGNVEQKRRGLRILQQTIAHFLPRVNPPLLFSPQLLELVSENPKTLRGRRLKGLEDRLDALICAYMTFYFWTWGEEKCAIFGDMKGGYIIGPKYSPQRSAISSQQKPEAES
jgi:predicted RNase H-like nuclease